MTRPDDTTVHWWHQALCAQTDPEAFFPQKGGSTREAKRICQNCDVRPECLHDAIQNGDRYGIRGGMSQRQRRLLLASPTERRSELEDAA